MITLTELCSCACGNLLLTRTERADNLCTACADAPAVSDVHPDIILQWAIDKGHRLAVADFAAESAA